ncbi:hypothetical protein OG884_17700 [Streptosporangium sp. NBC_01755]|uniref:hypothetical protein n=1 Tax=Streptosporangium sp. NBC_01755 TaxID=2975949 RepID=UPI002DDBE90B|nr:hypothetical protein [Streptosporangium sp. NBC_01755]WSD03643.1 hypothetical protein OG884_17700 [Streptosporangium sp. NBC_01755]
MHNPNALVLDRAMASGCDCFAESPPLPMGCAVCGHAPYAHGCPGQAADHEYAQPSGELMAERLHVRRRLGLGRTLPIFHPAHEVTAYSAAVVPAPRQAEPETTPTRTRSAGCTDARRPALSGTGRPYRPVEPREERTARLALAHDPLTRRRALLAARTPEHPSQNIGRPTGHPHPAELPDQPPLTGPPDITLNPRKHLTTTIQRTLAVPPDTNPDPRKHVMTLVQRMLTVLPDISPGTEDQRPAYQAPRPGFAVASGRGRSPDTSSSWRQHPHRQEIAA